MSEIYGRVTRSGDYVQIRLLNVDEDALVDIARQYVRDNNLRWNIRKPYAWTDYGTGPHISLRPDMKRYVGDIVPVRLKYIYHFVAPPSRWVAIEVELPPKYRCEYECHISIGQQRIG